MIYTLIVTFANNSNKNSRTQVTAYTVLEETPELAYENVTIRAEKECNLLTEASQSVNMEEYWYIREQYIADNAQVILTT